MLRPLGAFLPAIRAITGLVTCFLMYSAASSSSLPADFADHDDCLGLGIGFEIAAARSTNVEPGIISPPTPTQVDWPMPAYGQHEDRLIAVGRAAATSRPTLPRLKMRCGHEARLGLARGDDAEASWARSGARPSGVHRWYDLHHVMHGNVLCDGDSQRFDVPRRCASSTDLLGELRAVRRARRRSRRWLPWPSLHRIEHRHAEHWLAALAGRHAARRLRAVGAASAPCGRCPRGR